MSSFYIRPTGPLSRKDRVGAGKNGGASRGAAAPLVLRGGPRLYLLYQKSGEKDSPEGALPAVFRKNVAMAQHTPWICRLSLCGSPKTRRGKAVRPAQPFGMGFPTGADLLEAFRNFSVSPLTAGRRRGIMQKVFKDSGCGAWLRVNPAENAADNVMLRCFRVDTKAAVFLRSVSVDTPSRIGRSGDGRWGRKAPGTSPNGRRCVPAARAWRRPGRRRDSRDESASNASAAAKSSAATKLPGGESKYA